MPLGATYTVSGNDYLLGLLIANPIRETSTVINERLVKGSNLSVIDIVGKQVTKIKGGAFVDEVTGSTLNDFEGLVGSSGILVYAEGTFFVDLVMFERNQVMLNNRYIATIEFWITS